MVRLKDIAAAAGVSVMTVSKALRDAPDISTSTKTRLRLLAAQMGYVPDSMAQGLRTKTTRLFGLVISSVANPLFARIVMAIEEGAHELGYQVVLAHSQNNAEREETAINRLLARRVDGLFVSPVYRLSPSAPIYQELKARGTPTVLLGQRAPFCQDFASVETDDFAASHNMTRHLLDLGHRRIAFFAGAPGAPWATERLDGYRKGLRDANIEPDDRLIFNAGQSLEDGEKAALQMLNEGVEVTAIQAVNDLVGIGAASILIKQGVKVPEHVSVAGFGNVLLSEYFRVPLTTVRQPKFRLGVAAMETMQKLLRKEPVDSKRLPAELEIRASTGPAPV